MVSVTGSVVGPGSNSDPLIFLMRAVYFCFIVKFIVPICVAVIV